MSTACVLDTHAWADVVGDPGRLPRAARRRVQQSDVLYVPAICLRELALLEQRGVFRRRDPDMELERWFTAALGDPCELAELTPRIAVESAALEREGFHRDPADQLIYATARVLGAPLITRDERIRGFDRQQPKKSMRLAIWD